MRIEIVTGHDARKTYFLIEKNDLLIGSSKQCDVVVPSTDVSRRHLSVMRRGDRYFVIDHASTNGSYLNEEKIPSGEKIEWKSYVPIRLATGVILTLVEDADVEEELYQAPTTDPERDDQTRVISLDKLKAAKTPKRPPMKKKEKKKGMGLTWLMVIGLLAGAWYLHDLRSKNQAPKKARSSKAQKN